MECSAGLVFFMQEVMRLKKTSQTTDLVLALFLYIPVIWAALLIAQSLGGGLPELLSNLTAALEQPFQIQWTDKSLLSILVCTGAYLMGLCLYASGQGRTRDGEEHGSAAWGSPRQLNAQFRQKQNKILTRHVRLGLDRDTPLTLADERIARAIRENNARLVIIDPVQAFLGADVDMNRANEVRPIFRSLGDIAQATGCAIVLIGHLNKAAGTQSTYRGLGSIDITAAVRSLLFIGKLKDSPTMRVLIHEKSSLAPPGQSLAFSLGDEKGFEWIGAYDITADELLAGTDTAKTESKTAQAQMLILELLADGKRMPSAELEKTVNERGISSRTMRTAKSRIGDRLVTEKDGTAWVCYLRD